MITIKRLGSDVATGVVNPFIVAAEQKVIHKFKPRIYGTFETSEDFLYTLEVLEIAEENDVVELHISSNGGSASALSTLLHAMEKCSGYIHCIFTGTVASAGTFPLFHCDSFEMAEDSEWLFHEAVAGTYPSTCSDAADQMAFTKRWNERIIRSNYEGFFDEGEIQMILNGKQWRAFPEEVNERMERRNEYLENKAKEQEKQVRKQQQALKRIAKRAGQEGAHETM